MSEFLKNDMFDVFHQNSLKRKAQPPNDQSSLKKLKSDNNSHPMQNLEQNLVEISHGKQEVSDLEEEEKDVEIKDITAEKEKEVQKKYILEKFDIDVTTENFGCVHEIVSPKGYQRKGINIYFFGKKIIFC